MPHTGKCVVLGLYYDPLVNLSAFLLLKIPFVIFYLKFKMRQFHVHFKYLFHLAITMVIVLIF